jgi:hypothetical protein
MEKIDERLVRRIEIEGAIVSLTALLVHADLSDAGIRSVINRLKVLREERRLIESADAARTFAARAV